MPLANSLISRFWQIILLGTVALSSRVVMGQEDSRFGEKPLFEVEASPSPDSAATTEEGEEDGDSAKAEPTAATTTSIWDFMTSPAEPEPVPTAEPKEPETKPDGHTFPKELLESAAGPDLPEGAMGEPTMDEPTLTPEPTPAESEAVEPESDNQNEAETRQDDTSEDKKPALPNIDTDPAAAPAVNPDPAPPEPPPPAKESDSMAAEPTPEPNPAADKVDKAKAAAGKTSLAAKPIETKTILDLQNFLSEDVRNLSNGDKTGKLHLVNLNPNTNAWYLLRVAWDHINSDQVYHLEVRDIGATTLKLTESAPPKLVIAGSTGTTLCDFWTDNQAVRAKLNNTIQPYIELCDGLVYLRNQVEGHRSTKEWFVDILRDQVWGGEQITTFVKRNFFKDKFLLQSKDEQDNKDIGDDGAIDPNIGPLIAKVAEDHISTMVQPKSLGIKFLGGKDGKLYAGRWYRTAAESDVYVSVLEPKHIDPSILESHSERTRKLDATERSALAYFVAFDLSAYELHYRLGTDHPRVDWSNRTLDKVKNSKIKGPDGFDSKYPLASTGMIPPHQFDKTVATFTGGFKRTHGAFKWGKLSLINSGSHYGFVENGVVFSRMNPGLSTLVIGVDGSVTMKTWTDEDSAQLNQVLHARQNGVPIVEFDAGIGDVVPGKLVNRWGQGNWSGSQSSNLRTLRAGACIQQRNERKFLIYGYFSSVTPSAMARAFQAYNCRYAMHLDMNALEHTYLSVLSRKGDKIQIENLIQGMNVLDKSYKDQILPRFLGFADNRDFFYLIKK